MSVSLRGHFVCFTRSLVFVCFAFQSLSFSGQSLSFACLVVGRINWYFEDVFLVLSVVYGVGVSVFDFTHLSFHLGMKWKSIRSF